jgi:hypothetical protein
MSCKNRPWLLASLLKQQQQDKVKRVVCEKSFSILYMHGRETK